MNNEIRKVVLLMKDGKTLNGIVVIRNNEIKSITSDLMKEYGRLIDELKNQNKDKLGVLTGKELANKLKDMGLITRSLINPIINITIEQDEEINQIKIIKADGSIELIKKSDYPSSDLFEVLYSKYGKEINESLDIYDMSEMEELNKIGFFKAEIKEVQNEESNEEFNEEESEDEVEDEIEDELDDENLDAVEVDDEDVTEKISLKTKLRNFAINHKVVSGLIIAGATFILCKTLPGHIKKNSNGETVEDQPQYVYVLDTPDSFSTVEPTLAPQSRKSIYFEGEESIFGNYQEPESDQIIIQDIHNNTYRLGDGQYNYSMDNLHEIRRNEMSSIANNIQSGIKLEGNGSYIYFENKYNNNLTDKIYIKYFSMIGNEVIKNAYNGNNNVSDYARLSATEVLRLIRDDNPIHVYVNGNSYYIRYSELSTDAKDTVLNIAWANTFPLYKEIVNYNGTIYNQDQISDIIIECSNNLYEKNTK